MKISAFCESQQTFRRDISPPSSGITSKPSKKQASRRQQSELLLAGFLLHLLFDPEDGGDVFLRNIG
jgi:hypothetical protein